MVSTGILTAAIIISLLFILFIFLGIVYMFRYRKYFAFNSIKREADSGKKDAMLMLGYIYYTGSNNQKQDMAKAIEYFQKAADAGSSQAEYLLGGIYVEGKAVERDVDKGVAMIRSAADGGNPHAQRSMGNILADGNLAKQDTPGSVQYFMLAAANGDMISQKTMAGIYQFTKDMDRKIAYAWYCLAADQDDNYSKDMSEKLLEEFAVEDQALAMKIADEYRAKFGKRKLND